MGRRVREGSFMKIRVIASDFDGTILKDGAQEVDSGYFPLIRALKERGIFFIAASGRQYGNLRRLLKPVADEIGYICENGALIAQGDRVLCQREIDRRLVFSLIEDAKKVEGARMLVSCAEASCVLPEDPGFITLLRERVKNTVKVYGSFQQITEPIIKMALYWAEGIPELWEEWFQEKYGRTLNVADGGGGWLDFTGRDVDKGSALSWLAARQGFELEEVLSFGDSGNDIGMLRAAGLSYAMNTAKPEVKACADRECALVSDVLRAVLDGTGRSRKQGRIGGSGYTQQTRKAEKE